MKFELTSKDKKEIAVMMDEIREIRIKKLADSKDKREIEKDKKRMKDRILSDRHELDFVLGELESLDGIYYYDETISNRELMRELDDDFCNKLEEAEKFLKELFEIE